MATLELLFWLECLLVFLPLFLALVVGFILAIDTRRINEDC
jgi:hypothetical protein